MAEVTSKDVEPAAQKMHPGPSVRCIPHVRRARERLVEHLERSETAIKRPRRCTSRERTFSIHARSAVTCEMTGTVHVWRSTEPLYAGDVRHDTTRNLDPDERSSRASALKLDAQHLDESWRDSARGEHASAFRVRMPHRPI